MAEAVGLVVGVVALIGTFEDCIDLFPYLSSSRELGRDYEILGRKAPRGEGSSLTMGTSCATAREELRWAAGRLYHFISCYSHSNQHSTSHQ
jgi:hypothetical protein